MTLLNTQEYDSRHHCPPFGNEYCNTPTDPSATNNSAVIWNTSASIQNTLTPNNRISTSTMINQQGNITRNAGNKNKKKKAPKNNNNQQKRKKKRERGGITIPAVLRKKKTKKQK